MVKSPAFVPAIETLLKFTVSKPTLVITAPCEALVVPTVCVVKVRLEVTVNCGGIPVSGLVGGGDSNAQAEFAVDTSAID
jgi:hypothetical protein